MASENVRKQFKLLVIMAALSLWFTSLFGVQAEAASQLASNRNGSRPLKKSIFSVASIDVTPCIKYWGLIELFVEVLK